MNSSAQIDETTQQTLREIQLQLAGQVGAMIMLSLSFLLLVIGVALVGAHSRTKRRLGFAIFALDAVVVLLVPSLVTMVASPTLLTAAIVGYIRARPVVAVGGRGLPVA